MKAENHRVLSICASIFVVISFFMPWISFAGFASVSAWTLLTSEVQDGLPSILYLLFLIPASAAVVFLQKLVTKTSWSIFYFIPMLTVAGLYIYGYMESQKALNAAGDAGLPFDIGVDYNFFFTELAGIGFWCTIIASFTLFVLGFIRRR
jgi:hypothetical protein